MSRGGCSQPESGDARDR
eukprot:gene26310-biopygen15750